MAINVPNGAYVYTGAAAAYDGYTIDEDFLTRLKSAPKNNSGMPSEEFLKAQAEMFERPEVKEFFSKNSISPISKDNVPKEVRERIEAVFANDSDAATVEISSTGKKLSYDVQKQERPVLQTEPVNNERYVVRSLVRTGYASIDNSIIDSLKNVSDEVRQSAYDIVRHDMLRTYTSGMSEGERQDRISLGLAEAQYIADNFLGKEDGDKFMNAMKKVAGIASKGVADATGKLSYDMPGQHRVNVDQDGHTVETSDTIGMMKRYDPEKYAKWTELKDEFSKTGNKDTLIASMKLEIQFILDNARKNPNAINEYEKEEREKVDKMSDENVSKAFDKINTSSLDDFMNSLKGIQSGNMDLQTMMFTQKFEGIQTLFSSLK